MAKSNPMVRGRHMKTFLEIVERLEEEKRARIYRALPEETLRSITTSTAIGWLPAQVNVEVTEVIARELGTRGADAFFRDLLLAGFEGPVLGALVRSVMAIAGGSPSIGFKWVPKGFNIIFRDCGEWKTLESVDGRATVEATGLPSVMTSSPLWLASVSSSLSAVFAVVKVTSGEVTVDEADKAAGTIRYVATWS